MNAIDAWDQASLETRKEICQRLEWPEQYAEGPADSEWLTNGQLRKLKNLEIDVGWNEEVQEFQFCPAIA
jgi:hypothetical protein